MEILGLGCVLAMQTSPVLLSQNWQDWQRQNPTYPGGIPQQQQPPRPRPQPGQTRSAPEDGTQASPTCINSYRRYLQQQQTRLQQQQPSLHLRIVEATDEYNSCLGSGSSFCSSTHKRLIDSQNTLKENIGRLDQIQADFALLSRSPQGAAKTLPCTDRWQEAFSTYSPCRRASSGCR